MTLGKRWYGAMLTGIGLILFGLSQKNWQFLGSIVTLTAGIVLLLPGRITGSSRKH